ncbi:MAG TPA: hypothetical protein VGJ41_14140 [Nocardioides sp.]
MATASYDDRTRASRMRRCRRSRRPGRQPRGGVPGVQLLRGRSEEMDPAPVLLPGSPVELAHEY